MPGVWRGALSQEQVDPPPETTTALRSSSALAYVGIWWYLPVCLFVCACVCVLTSEGPALRRPPE